jgi:hypothetical protein
LTSSKHRKSHLLLHAGFNRRFPNVPLYELDGFMNKESPKQSVAGQKFWDAFKACVEENRVRPNRSPFYVKWAKAYVDFLPGKRLRDRSRQDIEDFLADLAQRSGRKNLQAGEDRSGC